MSKIKLNIYELVGNTPVVQFNNLNQEYQLKGNIIGKIEYLNPAGSVKDRIAKSMIEAAEEANILKPGSKIVEATSGNTGIGLAALGRAKGYPVTLVMPDTMSVERRKFMSAYGAEFELTDGALGMKGAIAKALEMKEADDSIFIPSQFDNQANVRAHYVSTGPELEKDLESKIDVFVSGIGTGGTITGTIKYLNEKGINPYVVAVEPATSAVLSNEQPGKHKIQGIGAGFIPSILNTDVYDEVFKVSDEEAVQAARLLANREGFFVGISSGAALHAAMEIAKRDEFEGKNIVVILPDSGDRYLSTVLFD